MRVALGTSSLSVAVTFSFELSFNGEEGYLFPPEGENTMIEDHIVNKSTVGTDVLAKPVVQQKLLPQMQLVRMKE